MQARTTFPFTVLFFFTTHTAARLEAKKKEQPKGQIKVNEKKRRNKSLRGDFFSYMYKESLRREWASTKTKATPKNKVCHRGLKQMLVYASAGNPIATTFAEKGRKKKKS
jgi:hypothetical protein